MHKSLIVASICLAAAGCTAEQEGLVDVQDEAITARANLIDQEFISNDTFATSRGNVKVRMRFIRAEDVRLDRQVDKLDYEVLIDYVDAAGNIVFTSDFTYFARSSGRGTKYDIFDCDSSRNCKTEYGASTMYVFNDSRRGGKGVRLKQDDDFSVIDTNKKEILFSSVRK